MGAIWLVIIAAYVAIVLGSRAQQEAKRRAQGDQGARPGADAQARAARREAARREMEQQLEEATRFRAVLQPQPTGSAAPYAVKVQRESPAPAPAVGSGIASRIESRIVDRMVAPATAAPAQEAPVAAVPAVKRLTRLAAGGLRGAFVLSEILGPPRGGA